MTFEQAVEIAARELAGLEDRFGEPELQHVLRVAQAVPEEARVVAALHETVEDTDVTVEDLKRQGLSETEAQAVELLTHTDEEPYMDYIERVVTAGGRAGELARIVKEADLRDNLSRTTPEMKDLRERYEKALARLGSEGVPSET